MDTHGETIDAGAPRGRREAAMRFILLVVLIDMLSVGIIVPVLPSLVGTFTTNPAEQTTWYGVIVFAFAISSFVFSPILGALSDTYGRRRLLLVGFCGLALNFFVTGAATALWMLAASRIVGGAMQANAAVASAYIADITAPELRSKRFGQMGAMFGIGFIAGPVIGGLLGGISLHLPFFVSGVLALLNFAYGFFVLPESLPVERRRPFSLARANPFSSLRNLGGLGSWWLVGIYACSGLAQFTLFTTWVLYTTFRFHWGPTENGWSLFAVGLVAALVQGLLLGRLMKHFSAKQLALAGLFSSALAFLGYGLATAGWVLYVVIVAGFLGNVVGVVMQGIVSSAADPTRQGETMGALTSLSSLMAVIAPLFGAPVLALVSHLSPGDWRMGASMFFCSALQTMALVFAIVLFNRLALKAQALPT
jgi:MFS transporter, DHA1 family, tetracycline resistance protein